MRWRVTDGPARWAGTEIGWRLDQHDEYTIVQFTHEGWREPVEFLHHCTRHRPDRRVDAAVDYVARPRGETNPLRATDALGVLAMSGPARRLVDQSANTSRLCCTKNVWSWPLLGSDELYFALLAEPSGRSSSE